jgi:hypothetical protein
MKKKMPPLILDRIIDQSNLFFLSLIEYRRIEYIGIIDDITSTHVKAYTFENIRPNSINQEDFLSTAIQWYYRESDFKPLSISLSSLGLTSLTSPLFKTFDLNGISRIVGNPFIYSKYSESTTKKKKVLSIPEGIAITLKKV